MKKLLLALLLCATPAFADNGLPPAKWDIGGDMIGEALSNFVKVFGPEVQIKAVEYGKAQAVCNEIAQRHYHENWLPYAIADNQFFGCMLDTPSEKIIVYSYDYSMPWLGVQIFRHEVAHLMGWPSTHPRD